MTLAGLCAGSTAAQPVQPDLLADWQHAAPVAFTAQPYLQLAALAPFEKATPPNLGRENSGPFGATPAHSGAMSTKWRSLQPAMALEARILELCRADREICPPAAARFLAIVESGRERSGRARIGEINRAVNLAIRPASDAARYPVADIWTTPLTTFASGTGDCEDYAIAKYVALREAGVAPEDLRIVIVRDAGSHQDHAVAAARVDGEWLILDNRHMLLLTDNQAGNLKPLATLDHQDGVHHAEAARES